jgi:hypothetical protein
MKASDDVTQIDVGSRHAPVLHAEDDDLSDTFGRELCSCPSRQSFPRILDEDLVSGAKCEITIARSWGASKIAL